MYEIKKFDHLLGLEGFGDELLTNHFTLYEGYVNNTNKVSDTLAQMLKEDKTTTPEYAELKRRFGWEFDGMRLHELYFGNLMKDSEGPQDGSDLVEKIKEDFGSLEAWEKDFRATGSMRGIGWVALYYDKEVKRLFNAWIGEHDGGHLATCEPIIIMDVFEHAYMVQYGLKKADYINSFMGAICWHVADGRFKLAR